MKQLLLGMTALAAVMTSSPSRAQVGPSFNCAYAKAPDEVLICQNAELATLDREMAALYSAYFNSLTPAQKREWRANQIDWTSERDMRAYQAAWLKSRHACGYDYDCIRTKYEHRIGELKECGL